MYTVVSSNRCDINRQHAGGLVEERSTTRTVPEAIPSHKLLIVVSVRSRDKHHGELLRGGQEEISEIIMGVKLNLNLNLSDSSRNFRETVRLDNWSQVIQRECNHELYGSVHCFRLDQMHGSCLCEDKLICDHSWCNSRDEGSCCNMSSKLEYHRRGKCPSLLDSSCTSMTVDIQNTKSRN
jgi:hypothetical protein